MSTLTRKHYLATGLDLLAEGGVSAVTIAALCERLGVTKGSFYHHFTSGPDFHQALLADWEQSTYERIEEARAVSDSHKRLSVLKELGVAAHHEAESAIRAWARGSELAAAVVRRVDAAREANLVESFRALGIPPTRARHLARIGLATLIGTQSLEHPVDRKRLLAVFDEYQEWLESATAEQRGGRRS
ncbi:MAG TPA: TetR/AcrR family transcriptional regulator [Acidimicrobiia bacterium]|nr:TetR/AcrR family transcriptional regulator [Acidimicrobiia bacterium]